LWYASISSFSWLKQGFLEVVYSEILHLPLISKLNSLPPFHHYKQYCNAYIFADSFSVSFGLLIWNQ
jgi:hypothetical protein